MKTCIAIIPARQGSKRIPGKNIKPFLGKPIIEYSIRTALRSDLFDEVMVSTDSKEIAEISRKLGASVPFLRSTLNSDDFTGIAEVIFEVIENYRLSGKSFEYFCCILPTAPLINEKHLEEGFSLLNGADFDSVFPVLQYSYPILRSLKKHKDRIEMNWPENYNSRSQDLPPAYHDAGQFYWMKTETFMEQKKLFTDNSGGIELSELEVQDIDSDTDWIIAEIKYKILNNEFQDSSHQS